MFRRSRLSIRPNVGTSGRTSGSSQETSSNTDQDNTNTTFESHVSVNDNKSADPPTEQTPGIDQNGEAASSSAIQRRKRFSVRPKVVPGRPSALPRTPKSPIKPVIPSVKSPVPVINKTDILIEADRTAPLQELLTPKECQPSNEIRLSQIDTVSPSECSSKCLDQPIKLQSSSCSQIKEISPKAPVPPSIPDREAIDISEKAKTLVSKTELKTSSQHFSLTQLLNDKSDLLRLEKARKLRQLLKQEMLKEKSKKYIARVKEYTLDPSKMTMRDLIHYLPTSNPMLSTLEESALENETVIPQSPEREASPERAQELEVHPKMLSPGQREATATTLVEGKQGLEEEEAEEAADDEEALMVPQVKVAEDGSLIIDEESLTVEVQRMKGPNPIQDRDPIFERGSTTTYSSFRKGTHTKPWSTEETDMFFLAISMVGTDFAMISQLFPHRARSEIKNKFKKEERHNAWRIDKAFRERRRLDLEYFKKLLEKILEFQQNKKKLKLTSEKPKTSKRKTRVKKAVAELSDVDEQNEDGGSIEEQEGEKENLCNEKKSSSKTKGKRKCKDVLSSESPVDKKRNKRENKENKNTSDDAGALADLEEVAIPEDHLSLDQAKTTETQAAKTAEAKLSKSLPLGRKGRKAKKSKAVVSDTEGETTSEETVGQQSTKRMSDNDSSNHETSVQSTKPSRYGRISKPVQPLNYPTKEDTNSSTSDTLASPAHHTAAAKAKNKTNGKRRRSTQQKMEKESKKPKLITLRASQSEGSDDDEEEMDGQHYDDENSTSAFVPASLCSPKPVVPEVQETMEELDMLAHMPDVLGMSKNALCPNASCEQVQNERGTVEPCEHQLDLLVDVIDFLSEHTEASGDESYNEAAQTLLEIGNLANLAQPTESQQSLSDHISKLESSPCCEVKDLTKSSFEQEECTELISEASKTENIPTNRPMEQPPPSFASDTQTCKQSGELSNTEDTSLSPQVSAQTAKNSLPTRKGRLSKIKPKPNVVSSTRTTKRFTQSIGGVMKSQGVDIAATSQHQTLGQVEESTLAVFETDHGPADDTTLMSPISHVSNTQDSHEPCCKQDTVDSPQLQTTPEPKINSSPPRLSEIKPSISCALRTTKQTVKAVEENPQVESEIPSATQLRSVEHQEESTLSVLEQNESCSPQGTAATQLEPLCAKNSSPPRKGRLSKIKPKPNIGCASRSKKLSPQNIHAIEDKIQDESEIASSSQCGSSEHQVESTETLSEQSNCKSKNETDDTTENLPVSQSSDTQVIKHCDEPSSKQETAPVSQLETPSSKNSTAPRTERFSKIKAKPNFALRTAKLSSQSVGIIEETQTADKTATDSQLQSVAPLSESKEGSCVNFKETGTGTEADQSNRIVLTRSEICEPQEPGEEPSTLKKPLGQFPEMSCTPSVPCTVEPLEQPRPFENVTSLEPEISSSTQNDHSLAEEKTEKITCVKLSDPSSESLKHSTPQRRRWIPKIKPKPNLVSSLRTANSRSESKEITEVSDHLVKSSLLNAISEQPVLQDSSTANQHDNLQSVAVEPNSASTVPLMLGISLGEETTNVSKTGKTHEDPVKVQEPCEPSAANQTNMDHCNYTDCVPFVSSKSNKTQHQLEDLTLNNTEIYAVSNFHVETCEISSDHIQPAESAVEPSTELQHNDVAPVFGPGQMQDSSVQNSFEYQSLLFPNIPPDQVPSDPDEPFFILSLTEIPVCPSGEEVNPRPESYHALTDTKAQQSNPVEPVVPLAAGIDDSLSNIHIPTPEKATLKSELICVEQYLPSAPSVDISLLKEPQENSSVRRLNLTESGTNIDHSDTLSADKQPSIRGDVKKSSRRQTLTRKSADKKTNKHEDTAQDPPEPFTQIKSEVVDSQAQQDSDGSKIKTYEARGNKSRTKNSKALSDPVWGRTEIHSSEEQTANVLSCSFSSKDNQSTSSSSELIGPNPSDSTNVLDEGPTDVLEYFFGDVFTEVESDCSVTGNIIGDAACCDKTQSQPAETKVNLRQHSNAPCGQQSPITAAPQKPEATADEATSSNLPGSSVTEATIDSNQQDNRKSRGRGKGNTKRKNKTSGEVKSENSRPQRKSTATNFPQALFQDNLKESTSSSSISPQTRETNHCSSLQNTSEILDSNQSSSVGSSNLEEEPTNVSQFFFSDVFTEVESNPSTAPGEKAEIKVDERDKRKVSSDPCSGQHSALTEAQRPDATPLTDLQNTPSSVDVTTTDSSQRDAKMTRGKRSSKKKSNICEPLRSLRKSTEALKTPETVIQDSLIETKSTSSAVQPENLRGSLWGSTQGPLHKNYSAVEVDCGHSSVTGTTNDDDACGETQSQTSETSGKTRKKRQTKGSSGPLLIQEPVTPEAQKTTVDPSHDKKEKGKGRFNRKNKPSDGDTAKCSQPQRPNTAASKSPARVKEAQVELEGSNMSDIKESSPFDDEPTNVSQYFLSDIFTDVDEEFK